LLTTLLEELANWIIPAILLLVPLAGLLRRVDVYGSFVAGAGEGFVTAVRIMPFLVAMLVAISVFRDSGALEAVVGILSPWLQACGIPAELLPLAVMRPLSGSGSLAMTAELLSYYGPDSLIGQIASTVLGSTDTTFYILTVYFGAVGVSRPRYAIFVGLLGDLTGFLGSVYVCRYLFSP